MPEKESRWLRTTLQNFRLRKEERSGKDGGHRRDDQTLSHAASATSIKNAAESSLIDAGMSQTARVDPTLMTTGLQLWDRAYDDLKQDRSEAKLFELYETILSRRLGSSDGVMENVIEQDRMKRQSQMEGLLNTGLDKTAKLVHVEKNIGEAINIVLSVKEAIGSALQAVPIAALAWTGVCVALQVFLNPIDEMTTNRNGIIQVVRTMKWYSSLAKLLLGDASKHDTPFTELRRLLEERILDLYKAVLKYNVKSVCAYDRHPALTLLRNSVKLDDWTGSLDDVSKAEDSVRAAASDYGVRQANSYLGLLVNMHVSRTQDEMMQKLCVADMTAEIESLQERKDHLLADSYKWILNNSDYQNFTEWHPSNTKRLLWIKGDAGKGKTMLLIGIVGELTAQLETHFDKSHLSYFFCQGTDDRLNTATAILRGLIWMLVRQQKSLIHHLDMFKDLGPMLFEGRTAFYNLKKVLQSMLEDDILERAYLIIDALDECRKEEPGLPQLLELISEMSGKNDKVKWLVSSRNEREIEMILEKHTARTRLSLELNAESVASAVEAFTDCKISELAETYRTTYADKYSKIHEKLQRIQGDVANELHRKADGTFLWVALVFKQIKGCGADKILERVQEMPSGLYSMYAQMMRRVKELEDAAECKRVLLTMVNTYRPLHLSELVALADLPDLAVHRDIVRSCGLFTIRENDDIVYFVHQSAKDYLKNQNSDVLSNIFPNGYAEGHLTIVTQSLGSMTQILHKDIYALRHPGFAISEITAPDLGPLASIRYSCVYWIDHLCEIESSQDREGLYNNGTIEVFLQKHFLHWLEALSFLSSISEGILSMIKLEGLFEANTSLNLYAFAYDAKRFFLHNRSVIEQTPLQIYCSALVFTPEKSIIRKQSEGHIPDWIRRKTKVQADWTTALQTLEGHSDRVYSVAFSPDGKRVVSGSWDKTVRLWDAITGAALQTLEGHSSGIYSVAFSPDGKRVMSGSDDKTVRLWDAITGAALQTLEGHSSYVRSVAFSPDGKRIVSGSGDRTVRLWDAVTGAALQTLEGHSSYVNSVAFSPDGKRVMSGSDDKKVRLWDAITGAALQMLEGHSSFVNSVAFSPDGKLVVSGSADRTLRLWNAVTGATLQTLEGHSSYVRLVAFSPDGKRVVSGSFDKTVRLWDAITGAALQTLEGHSSYVCSVDFSPDSKRIVSGSGDRTVRLWDAVTGAALQTLEGHSSSVNSVAFSPDGKRVVSGSDDKTLRLWDTFTGVALQMLKGHSSSVNSVAFSPNGKRVVSGSDDKTLRLWDAVTSAVLQTLEGHSSYVYSVAFSPDGKLVVSGSWDRRVRLWDAVTGEALQTLKGHSSYVSSVAFSPDGKRVVSGSADNTVRLWDAVTDAALQTLEGHWTSVDSVAFSSKGKVEMGLSIFGNWVVEGKEKLLWLPSEYRATCEAVWNEVVVIGHSSGKISVLEFIQGSRYV